MGTGIGLFLSCKKGLGKDVKTGNGLNKHFVTMTSRDMAYFRGSGNVEKMFQTPFLSQSGECLSNYSMCRTFHW